MQPDGSGSRIKRAQHGILILWLDAPEEIFQFQPSAYCGSFGKEEHRNGVGLPTVRNQVSVVPLDGSNSVKNRLQKADLLSGGADRQYSGDYAGKVFLQNSCFFPILIVEDISRRTGQKGV